MPRPRPREKTKHAATKKHAATQATHAAADTTHPCINKAEAGNAIPARKRDTRRDLRRGFALRHAAFFMLDYLFLTFRHLP